jgi:hypothetical protein
MKNLFWLLFALQASAQSFSKADVGFAWNANSEPDLAGYRLYVATATSTNQVAVTTNTTCSVTFTNIGLHYVWVTAFNTSTMESGPSNVLTINTKAPVAPSTMKMSEFRVTYVAK